MRHCFRFDRRCISRRASVPHVASLCVRRVVDDRACGLGSTSATFQVLLGEVHVRHLSFASLVEIFFFALGRSSSPRAFFHVQNCTRWTVKRRQGHVLLHETIQEALSHRTRHFAIVRIVRHDRTDGIVVHRRHGEHGDEAGPRTASRTHTRRSQTTDPRHRSTGVWITSRPGRRMGCAASPYAAAVLPRKDGRLVRRRTGAAGMRSRAAKSRRYQSRTGRRKRAKHNSKPLPKSTSARALARIQERCVETPDAVAEEAVSQERRTTWQRTGGRHHCQRGR
mmetsp:Transcript_10440/g.63835  ORF Transcript_10440/g.63835 Transcript_10440/m.63835 type:complete len:281 (+) Transcript_10440:993-1835(+)